MSELRFHGAAGEVTGSMHLLRLDKRWIALDCGLFQGRRADSEQKNRQWPISPRELSAVVLSHAHIDHCGRLPLLAKDGFDGPIVCTPATRDLCAIMLPDSAHIQEEDVVYLNRKRARKGLPPVEALYSYEHALAAVRLMQTTSFDRWVDVLPGLAVRFHDAGHMLGSAGVELRLRENGATRTIYFTGDVGRPGTPILRDPAPPPPCDVLIAESTYGGRTHPQIDDARHQLVEIVRRTYLRGGKVIIPAFAVGRTQTLVYFLHQATAAGELPKRPIFVDSPLAVNATEVFKLHPECYDAEARAFHRVTGDILGQGNVTYIRHVEESKALHERRESCTIISASGMCEAGRIRHHIKNNIGAARNTILLVGFQAADTLGRRLADGARSINLFNEQWPVEASIEQLGGFSAHADQPELMQMLAPLAGKAAQTFLVHGEPDQSEALAVKLRGAGFASVECAQRDATVELR